MGSICELTSSGLATDVLWGLIYGVLLRWSSLQQDICFLHNLINLDTIVTLTVSKVYEDYKN